MKLKALLLSAIFAACIVPSVSQAAKSDEGKKKPTPAEAFAKMDVDQSDGLSKEEVAKRKALVKKFDKLDADQDGELSLEEFTDASGKKPKKAKKGEE
ncbi:EF-hand domain-containing protein [Coraliomargarita algicola]|uniref:EF-hand domain-containing protein n=1 Tax=Coraliomargarita algicola TaxID=3092156 RepID=A0ABZ0RSP9_9BACT|nr:EF-hand domain-containing protein [Coraliomargarita sp. J2-16]WPJ98106.1 EF-hand domain-containing protein [Coraliomargarita sp. J2-16]